MKTLIVTLNYNAPNLIGPLAMSLIEHLKNHEWHWLIRDNSTNSDTEDLIKKINSPRITLKRYKNIGNYASMHNDLMREGLFDGYDQLVLLNNDTKALGDFISSGTQKLRNKEVGAVGARLWYPNGQLQHCGVCISDNCTPFNVSSTAIKSLGLWERIHLATREYIAVTGAFLMMRTSDYKTLGGMNESLNWCFDDVDLCFRIQLELKKVCITEVSINLIHYENYTTLKNPSDLRPDFKNAMAFLKYNYKDFLVPDSRYYKMEFNSYA